ncbi:MAG: SLBB domain-containing protein [Gammaproteobacteria bacterium]|nr:SLBB domain-containing protein [Gammaproteobacteria bacterium]
MFLIGIIWSLMALAQSGPTDEQLRLFQQLPESERRAIIEAVLQSADGGTSDSPIDFPDLVTPLDDEDGEEESEDDIEEDEDDKLDLFLLGGEEAQEELELTFYEKAFELEPFGYDLFAAAPSTFAPATDIPVPPEYKIGPGDTIEVQLFGKENRQYSLVVNRDGTINFPSLGPVSATGQSFQDLKQQILDRISENMLGTSAAITMGALRSIRVFLLGDARAPGSYTVSGLSTITNALYVSGGVSEIGSLRNVQLRRAGRLIKTLDLYDLLIRGDTSQDARLQSGDVIFIPPIGETVAVGGYVKRPAIYELKNKRTAGKIIELAGGLMYDAFPERARLERINENWEREFLNIDLSTPEGLNNKLRAGDILLVPPVLERYRGGVRLAGHVLRSGDFEWHEGMRLTDLIPSLADLKPQSDINYALIRRETWPEKRVKALSADLENAINHPDSSDNVLLEPRDVVTVFDLKPERAELVEPLLEELRLQATSEDPFEKVSIGGRVRAPGTYPFERGMRVSDLLRAGANLSEAAYELNAEMARFEIIDGTIRRTRVISINPEAALMGDPEADILLEPYDSLQIREVQEWRDQLSVEITGEVRFPGNYSFNPGDTLVSVIERAGGLTDQAFPQGGIFLREQLREREIEQIDLLTQRIESDLASLALQAANENAAVQQAQSAGNALLSKLRNTRATGRLVIDLQAMLVNPDNPDMAVLLKDNDELMIPDISQDVTVLGEVQFPTSHLYIEGLDRSGYVDRSGGMTINAAEKQVYLVRANGAVFTGKTGWFGRGDSMRVEPGDTIVVPLDTQKVSKLQLWTNVTGVIYNLSIAVAAINGLND